MAGTRLAIHTIFFIQVVGLVGFALYQIRNVLLVDRATTKLDASSAAVALKSIDKTLIFPVSIRLFVTHVLLQTFPRQDETDLNTIAEFAFRNHFGCRPDHEPFLHLEASALKILYDESIVQSVCSLDGEEHNYDATRNFKRLHIISESAATEQEYCIILCPANSRTKVDILQGHLEHDIIRIYVNVEDMAKPNVLKTGKTAASFINVTINSFVEYIFFPTNVHLPSDDAKMPSWYHLNFILMDQDFREIDEEAPMQLQSMLLNEFSEAIHQLMQPLFHQISNVAGLTQITMDVATESFVSIDDLSTFLTQDRLSHRRNSRLLPFSSIMLGVPEPRNLQYILYLGNKLSSLPSCDSNDSVLLSANPEESVAHSSSTTTLNLPGYGAILVWNTSIATVSSDTAMTTIEEGLHQYAYRNDDKGVAFHLYKKIVPAVDYLMQSFLEEVGFFGKNISISHRNFRHIIQHSVVYQYEQYALQRVWVLRMIDYLIDEFLVLLEWLDRSSKLPISAKVARQINLIEEKLRAVQYSILETGQVSSAMKELQIVATLLQALKSDGTMVESRYWLPNDQMLAVFSPLIFPLLTPLLFGLLREVKRYRRLSISKKLS